MGIYGLKPAFRRSLAPVARWLGDVHPNAVSLAAVVIALSAGLTLLFAPRWPWLYLVAPVLFVLRLTANALDGMIAETQGTASPRGEMVNELSDRVSDKLILGGLIFSGAVIPALAWGALAVTLLVSYIGVLAKAAGAARNYAGPLGKADRMFLLGLACVAAYAAPHIVGGAEAGTVLDAAAAAFIVLGLLTAVNRTRKTWTELGGAA